MEWVEVTAKTVEAAKDKALDYLGVDETQAEFEVLEEPRSGFLGFRRSEARVRARVLPKQPRAKADRRDRRQRRTKGDRAPAARGRTRAGAPRRDREKAPAPAVAADVPDSLTPADAGVVSAAAGESRSRARKASGDSARRRNGRGSAAGRGRAAVGTADGDFDDLAPREVPVDPEVVAAQTRSAVDFLEGLADAFDVDASVTSEEVAEGIVEVRVEGADLGLLVGPRGATLDAVQELTRLAARRHGTADSGARLRVDIAGYRERRREALTKFAQEQARQVAEAGVAKALEPMTPPDRKVVHDAVTDIEGVSTISEGEEPYRRVVILPSA